MKTRFNFDVTSIEGLDESFERERTKMTIWEWETGGYKALYNSNLKRLKKEQEQKEIEQNKRKRK